MPSADIGIVGLGVMGRMLARNLERHGRRVAGYDLDSQKVAAFAEAGKQLYGYTDRAEFIAALEKPRRILIMVPAGRPVDSAIDGFKHDLEAGDLLIDGGNSHYTDTERRGRELEALGLLFIGTGVSGGEYGALWGPAIMPGGQPQAWAHVQPLFEAIAARVDGEPCVAYMGPRGAGHYVKMVHNGIEYADMQLIAEAYDLLHRGLGFSNAELQGVFTEWNAGELKSYLIEITAQILGRIDEETGESLVDLILDEAQHKGTGQWTSQSAFDLGAPIPTINAAVTMRFLSARKEERVDAGKALRNPVGAEGLSLDAGARELALRMVREALYAAKICSYAQGFALLRSASREYDYQLNYGEIARIWRGGCIIRAVFLDKIRAAYARRSDLPNLLLDEEFAQAVAARQDSLRQFVQTAAARGIPALAFCTALAYYDAYSSPRLPANLIQAQRDYFGAHTYRRIDKEGVFHTEWMDWTQPPEG